MMMTYEVRALEKILTAHSPVIAVEWGAGRSTLYFTRFLEKHNTPYTWISVEHNKEWAEYVQRELGQNPHVRVLYIPKEQRTQYLSAPQQTLLELGVPRATFALVDGIYRNECMEAASTFADIVLLHDAQRKSYRKRGKYIAGRLFKLGDCDDLLSRIHIIFYKIHETLWKLKELFIAPKTQP